MPGRPCSIPDDCDFAVAAASEAHEATEAVGRLAAEVSAQSETVKRVEALEQKDEHRIKVLARIDRRTRWAPFLQWLVPVMLTALGVYMGWRQSAQEDRIVSAVLDRTKGYVDSQLREHLQTVSQTGLDIAMQAVRLRDNEIAAAKNPAPITSAPDRVASRRATR